jgi:hypothetical protein
VSFPLKARHSEEESFTAQYAIQTVFDSSENKHLLVFYEVRGNGSLEKRNEFVIREGAKEAKCWLSDQLVTYQVVGHFVYFFRLTAPDSDADDREIDEEGEKNKWKFELIKYDLLENKEEVEKELEYTCPKKDENGYDRYEFDIDDGQKFEVFAVMLVDSFGGNKIDSEDAVE